MQYAETWDVEATEATMVQFDLYEPCSSSNDKDPNIFVEYSTDGGSTWAPVRRQCSPPDTSCPFYDMGSVFSPRKVDKGSAQKRRVMLELPKSVSWVGAELISLQQRHSKTWRYYYGVEAVCGTTLKPLHLHNPSTSVGSMEVVDQLENV